MKKWWLEDHSFLPRFLRKLCVISTLDSRFILHSNAHRLGKELQQNFAVCATTLAEFTQFLCAQRAENFREICNSFARVGREICVISTLDVFFFQIWMQCWLGGFPLMPPLVRHAWFGAYILKKKRPRGGGGARSCILVHFQRKFAFKKFAPKSQKSMIFNEIH